MDWTTKETIIAKIRACPLEKAQIYSNGILDEATPEQYYGVQEYIVQVVEALNDDSQLLMIEDGRLEVYTIDINRLLHIFDPIPM